MTYESNQQPHEVVEDEPELSVDEGIEQQRLKLVEVRPGLVDLYTIQWDGYNVQLEREGNSILCGPKVLPYEVYPTVNGKGLAKLFGMKHNIVRWVGLETALNIVDAAVVAEESGDISQLQEIIAGLGSSHFQD